MTISDLPDYAQDMGRDLPPTVDLETAAKFLQRSTRTLRREADRGRLMIKTGSGGAATIPRLELLKYYVSQSDRRPQTPRAEA